MNSPGIDHAFYEHDDYGGFVFRVRLLWQRRQQFTVSFDALGHASIATPSVDITADPPKAIA